MRSLFREHPEWELIAEVANGKDAVEKANELKPDVAIIDISMPEMNGLEATKEMLRGNPQAKVLILTMHDSEQAIEYAISAGARGYVLKADAGKDMVRAVGALLSGQTFFTQKAARILLDGFTGKRPKAQDSHAQSLSQVEKEILRLLAEGMTVKEAAAVLNVNLKKVESGRTELMRKFNCHSVSELVRYAVRNQLLEA